MAGTLHSSALGTVPGPEQAARGCGQPAPPPAALSHCFLPVPRCYFKNMVSPQGEGRADASLLSASTWGC